ncbi:MAG: GntR family transcriptional regulator [Streptomyces sp.]
MQFPGRALTPGQRLVEAELAETLGVCGQPIRGALQRLQTAGWVDLRPSQGAFVHFPTTQECAQLLSVRALLETHSARGAARHASVRDVARLWELQQTGLAALAAGDARAVVEAKAALHGHITLLSRNAVLAELITQVDRRVRWYYMPMARPRGKDAWNEHARMIEAISQGAVGRAEELMRRHTRNTTDFYCEQIAVVVGRDD